MLSDDGGGIEGDVVNGDGQPVAGGVMALRNGRAITAGANTHFKLQNLAPGDYHVAAWDTGDHEIKPGYRKIFETQAAAVSVHEGSHEIADVKLIVPE